MMETTTLTVQQKVAALAERTIPCPQRNGGISLDVNPPICDGCREILPHHRPIPDPRTAALRGKHEWMALTFDGSDDARIRYCSRCASYLSDPPPYCIPTGDRLPAALDAVTFAFDWAVTKFPPGSVMLTGPSLREGGVLSNTYETSVENHVAALYEAIGK